jgi:hypothetical protein
MSQVLLDTDTFNGTNGTSLPSYNANWVITDSGGFNNLTIEGTPGVGGAGSNTRNGSTWTNDQWTELTIDSTNLASDNFFVGVRITTGNANNCTGYWAGYSFGTFGNRTYRIVKFTSSSSFTNLVTGTHTAAVGDVVNVQIVGTSLTLTVNGVTEATVTDATYSTGSPGMNLSDATTTIRLGGTWRAGSVSSGDTLMGGILL